jgi:DNA topoisomerase VI subunit B
MTLDHAMKRLHRETVRRSMLLDYFTERDLTAQVGHGVTDWPLVAFKELLDNALDAAEDAGVAPEVEVVVSETGLAVADNGPGLPPETVVKILDFTGRVSSREVYVSPTRGAQGNALKTILAMPLVLDGKQGDLEICAGGVRHRISLRLDQLRQEPVIERQEESAPSAETGTRILIHWPDSPRCKLAASVPRILQIASDYAVLNPHLTLTVTAGGRAQRFAPTDARWRKWLPSDPTCPHWYPVERFVRLIAAYVALDQDRGKDRTVRAFVSEFRGLSGSKAQKAVLEATGLARAPLSALAGPDGIDAAAAGKLLAAMQDQVKPVKPVHLGVLGKDHLKERFEELGCEMASFDYKKVETRPPELPELLETAFAWRPQRPRRLITGVNFSPGIVNPFRELGEQGRSLDSLLERQRASRDEEVVVLLHFACPRTAFTDRGKSNLVLEAVG